LITVAARGVVSMKIMPVAESAGLTLYTN